MSLNNAEFSKLVYFETKFMQLQANLNSKILGFNMISNLVAT